MSNYKSTRSFEERKSESERVRARHPDMIPVIAERAVGSRMPDLEKKKFLMPQDMIVGHFMFTLRRKLKLPPEKAIFIFVDSSLIPPTSSYLASVYDRWKDADGFLYITYTAENTFGGGGGAAEAAGC